MEAAIPVLLTLLGQVAPSLGTSAAVGQVIGALIEITPVVLKEAKDLAPVVKNIISALRANPQTTADQLAQLDATEAGYDAAFEAAAAAAEAEDAAEAGKAAS